MEQDINVLAYIKEKERFLFLYDDTSMTEVIRTLGRYAQNPDLDFTWYDAAVLSDKVRKHHE